MDELPTFPAAYWNPDHSLTDVYYLSFTGEWRLYSTPIEPSAIPLEGLRKLSNYYPQVYILHGVEEEK